MTRLKNAWRMCVGWLFPKQHQFAAPTFSSNKAYVREWHRRQREALRPATPTDERRSPD